MNLTQLATTVCNRVNQKEAEDVAACKTFFTMRHALLWADQLWKDALLEYRQTVSANVSDYTPASNYLPTKGVLLLPPIITHVLAARTSGHKLNVHRPEFYYRIDYDTFSKTGLPLDFMLLPRCVWEFNTALDLYLWRSNNADSGLKINADIVGSDGVSVTRTQITMDADSKSLGNTDRIDALTKLTSAGVISFGPDSVLFAGAGTAYVNGAYFADSTGDYVKGADAYTLTTQVFNGNTDELLYGKGDSTFLGQWATVNGGAAPAPLVTSLKNIVSLAASDTSAPQRERVRFIEIPTQETVLRILGKRACPQFDADSDLPGIKGSEHFLVAMVHGDMLERDEQYGKAQAKFKEAQVYLDQFKRLEVVQQAHNSQITPEGGYGVDAFPGGGGACWETKG